VGTHGLVPLDLGWCDMTAFSVLLACKLKSTIIRVLKGEGLPAYPLYSILSVERLSTWSNYVYAQLSGWKTVGPTWKRVGVRKVGARSRTPRRTLGAVNPDSRLLAMSHTLGLGDSTTLVVSASLTSRLSLAWSVGP